MAEQKLGPRMDETRIGAELTQHKRSKMIGFYVWLTAWSLAFGVMTWGATAYLLTTKIQWLTVKSAFKLTFKGVTNGFSPSISGELDWLWPAAVKVLLLPWVMLPAIGVAVAAWFYNKRVAGANETMADHVEHVRGRQVVSEKALIAEVEDASLTILRGAAINSTVSLDIPGYEGMTVEGQDNAVIERKKEMTEAELDKIAKSVNSDNLRKELSWWKRIHIGEIPIPPKKEQRNILAVGGVGTGKSVILKRMLKDIEAAKQSAIIYDITGEYVAHFYRPARGDVILSPIMDARSQPWNVWAEVRDPATDYANIAAALVPTPTTGDKFWAEAAQKLFVNTAEGLAKSGMKTNHDLYAASTEWTIADLQVLVEGTASARYINESAEKTGLSVLSTLVQQLDVMRHLPDAVNPADVFSIRDWVSCRGKWKDRDPGAMLFLLSDARYLNLLRNLIPLWINVVGLEIMTSGDPTTATAKTWLIVDELASIGKIPSLPDTITQARKYGYCHMIGVQTAGQVKDIYGKEVADTIFTNCQSKTILRCDGENAKYWSETIGEREIWEVSTSLSYSVDSEKNTESMSKKLTKTPAVMPSEIAGLPDLEGYLLLPGFANIAKVKLNVRRMTKIAEPYVSRDGTKGADRDETVKLVMDKLNAEVTKSSGSLLDVMRERYQAGLAKSAGATPATQETDKPEPLPF